MSSASQEADNNESNVPNVLNAPIASNVPKRIFCYGDSLTAGTSPPLDGLFPYAPHLEQTLNLTPGNDDTDDTHTPQTPNNPQHQVAIRWRGLPGWTAATMADYLDDSSVGLRAVVETIRNPPLSLVIILAGTNDVGYWSSGMANTASTGDIGGVDGIGAVVDPILKLHKACLECDTGGTGSIGSIGESGGNGSIRTLAVGIPESLWQQQNPTAKQLCTQTNSALKEFASTHPNGRVTYVDFPFGFQLGDEKWCGDGLHLSPEGYEALGRGLAPCVKSILDNIDS